MTKPRILVQLDSDAHASVFDSVVAIDADVEHLLTHAGVEPTQVRALVHGAMFTRGPEDLKSTAVFIGGSDVAVGEVLLKQVTECFFGPMRVSVMLDANGANTTAAAAVLAAARHVNLSEATALVLAGTGPVGQRAARLLAREGAAVRIGSRRQNRAQSAAEAIGQSVPGAKLTAHGTENQNELAAAMDGVNIVIAAGAAGVQLLPADLWKSSKSLKVAIDLNAVSPAGIEGIGVTDKAKDYNGVIGYGAIGVGGAKMKIHKAAIRRLFSSNDQVLDAEEVYQIGLQLEREKT